MFPSMRRVILLGAGASHSYSQSPYGVQPPLSNGFFTTYFHLPISGDLQVHVGDIANYIHEYLGLPLREFPKFETNAEEFMTRLDELVSDAAAKIKSDRSRDNQVRLLALTRAYDQMVMLFSHVLNHICSGPVSKQYAGLIHALGTDATYVTFNWDTLLDRALWESGAWQVDDGYGVRFRGVMDNGWRDTVAPQRPSKPLLKLHGSMNWLCGYVSRHPTTGERQIAIPRRADDTHVTIGFRINLRWTPAGVVGEPEVFQVAHKVAPLDSCDPVELIPYCYLRSDGPYETYQNRYREGFEPFTYFYPPNGRAGDVYTMPLIVPPTKYKLYDEFRHILDPVWAVASQAISMADVVTTIGYSFPPTDLRAIGLFQNSLNTVNTSRQIEVVNPAPDGVVNALRDLAGVPSHKIKVIASTFDEYLDQLGVHLASPDSSDKIQEISLSEFNAFGPLRGPLVGSLIQERAWFSKHKGEMLGVITYDTEDGDWGYVILTKDHQGSYRGYDVGVSRTSFLNAKYAMLESMEKGR